MGRLRQNLFFLLLLLLPLQLGRHFWPNWTQVLGIRIDYLSPTLYLTDVLLFFLFLFYSPRLCFLIKNYCFKKRLLFLGFFVVLLGIVFGILGSQNVAVGFYKLVKWGETAFFVFYLSQEIKEGYQVKKIVFLLSLGVVFESLLSLGQFLKQGSLGGLFWWFGERTFSGQTPGIAQASLEGTLLLRPYGTFPHPNVLAGYLVVTIVLLLGVFYRQRAGKVIKWLAVGLGGLALFFTFSRAAWLIGLLAIALILVVQKKWLLLFLTGFFLLLELGFIWPRFQSLLGTDRSSWQKREELNIAAFKMIKDSPVFGVGLGNFLVELPNYYQEREAVRFLQPAHNFYLMLGAETGLFGLGTFLGFLLLTFKRLLKKQSSLTLLVALSAIFSLSFFDHYFYTLWQGQLLAALVFGLSWAKITTEKT